MNTEIDFLQVVYDNACNNNCLDINILKKHGFDTTKLNDNTYREIDDHIYYQYLIQDAMTFFTDINIIHINEGKYYLSKGRLRFSWDNIKKLNIKHKILLWMLRKLVVDSLIKIIKLELQLDEIMVLSVGSTSLSSDYDITLYGNTQQKLSLIREFKERFFDMFNDDSFNVFDTNLYALSFIGFNEIDSLWETIECNNSFLNYLTIGDSDESQLVWALVKFFKDFKNSFGDGMYSDLLKYFQKKINLPHIKISKDTFTYLSNKDPYIVNYENVIDMEEDILNKYNDAIIAKNDFTSLVNFFGVETYFSRGAFLDTVVNNQMCKNTNNINLNDSELISSILENSGFFFIHNTKTKYFLRVYNTLQLLQSSYPRYDLSKEQCFIDFESIINTLKTTIDGKNQFDENYCKWIDTSMQIDSVNLLSCEKFPIFTLLVKIVYKIIKIYSYTYNTGSNDFLFYKIFVKSDTNELGIRHMSPLNDIGYNNNKFTRKESLYLNML